MFAPQIYIVEEGYCILQDKKQFYWYKKHFLIDLDKKNCPKHR